MNALPYLSASRVTTAEQCLRKYEQRYVVKRASHSDAKQLEMGTVAHDTLEDAGAGLIRTRYRGPLPLDRLIALYRRKFAASTLTGVEWFADGEECMRKWVERMGEVDGAEMVVAEAKFRFVVGVEGFDTVPLFGFIDRVDRLAPGHYRVTDYKTSRTIKSTSELRSDVQLGVYDLAVRHLYPDAHTVELGLDYLRHGVATYHTRTDAEREDLTAYLVVMAAKLRGLDKWPANPNNLCSWCEYRNECVEYQAVVNGDVAVEVVVGDVDTLAEQWERAKLTEKLARARKSELEKALVQAMGDQPELRAQGRVYRRAGRTSYTYDRSVTIDKLAEALDLTPEAADHLVSSVDKAAVNRLLKTLDPGPRALLKAELEASGTARRSQWLESKDAPA